MSRDPADRIKTQFVRSRFANRARARATALALTPRVACFAGAGAWSVQQRAVAGQPARWAWRATHTTPRPARPDGCVHPRRRLAARDSDNLTVPRRRSRRSRQSVRRHADARVRVLAGARRLRCEEVRPGSRGPRSAPPDSNRRALCRRARAAVASAGRARRRFHSRKDGLRRGSSRRSRRTSARTPGRASTITSRSSRTATAPLALRNGPSTTTSTSDRACPPPPTADAKRRTSVTALCWVLKSRDPPRRRFLSGRNRPQCRAGRLNRDR